MFKSSNETCDSANAEGSSICLRDTQGLLVMVDLRGFSAALGNDMVELS